MRAVVKWEIQLMFLLILVLTGGDCERCVKVLSQFRLVKSMAFYGIGITLLSKSFVQFSENEWEMLEMRISMFLYLTWLCASENYISLNYYVFCNRVMEKTFL